MRKLDPQLEFLVEGGTTQLSTTGDPEATFERFGVGGPVPGGARGRKRGAAAPSPEVTVLAQYAGDPEALEAAGLKIRSVAGDVVTGTIALSAIKKLAAIAEVERVE